VLFTILYILKSTCPDYENIKYIKFTVRWLSGLFMNVHFFTFYSLPEKIFILSIWLANNRKIVLQRHRKLTTPRHPLIFSSIAENFFSSNLLFFTLKHATDLAIEKGTYTVKRPRHILLTKV